MPKIHPPLTRLLTYLLISGLFLIACGLINNPNGVITGSGVLASETRPVSGIEAVALLGSGQVIITQGATEGLTVEAEDNLLPYITSNMDGGTLALDFDRPSTTSRIAPTLPIRYLVSVRDLAAIDLAGSGSFTAQDLAAAGDFALTISGSGDVNLRNLTAASLRADIGGSGNANLDGRVTNQSVTISGSGNYNAGDLESQAGDVTVSGSGNVTAWVTQSLSILISGSGTVSYYGQPTVARRDITGSGDINPMGSK